MRPTAAVRGAQDKTSIVDPSRKHSRNLILVVAEMQFNSLCNHRCVQNFQAQANTLIYPRPQTKWGSIFSRRF